MGTREVRIGLTVVMGVVLIYLTIAWARRIHFFAPEVLPYQIVFDHVDGLLEGDVVNVRGYPAGRVVQIAPRQNEVDVYITLDQRIQVYEDALAEIQIKEIMGGKQISLLPGQQGSPLTANAIIRGHTSLDFASSFSEVGQFIDRVDEEKLSTTLERLDRMARHMEAIVLSIDPEATGRIVQNLDQGMAQIDALTRPLSASRIDQTWQRIDELLLHADQALMRIDTLMLEAEREAIPRADSLLTQVQHTLALVDGLAGDIQVLTTQLQDEKTLVGQLLQDTTLPRQIDTLLHNVNATLEQIQERKVIVGFRLKPKQ